MITSIRLIFRRPHTPSASFVITRAPRSIATPGEFEQVELNASEHMSDFQGIRGSRGIACEMIKTGVQTFEFA